MSARVRVGTLELFRNTSAWGEDMFHIYNTASEIDSDLKDIILNTQEEFIAMGVSFGRSTKNLRDAYEDRLKAGVKFTFVTLSKHCDFGLFASQFGQSVDELRAEVMDSYAVLEAYHKRYPGLFNFFPTKRCPNYRIYISDPHSGAAPGIINFYGSSTDSPNLPAFRFPDFKSSWAGRYFNDALTSVGKQVNKKVFIIHGHAEAKWRELEELVRNMGLEPVVLRKQPSRGSSTLIEKFEAYARECSYAIAIFTPDDWIRNGDKEYFQPRPNALYEVGWFSAHLGRAGVLILVQGNNTSLPSDLQGVVELRFHTDVSERMMDIRNELVELELIDG